MSMSFLNINTNLYFGVFAFIVLFGSCNPSVSDDGNTIDLKWNKSYPKDSIERNIIGLKWCLSFLGSTIAADTTSLGIRYTENKITLNVEESGFSPNAIEELKQLHLDIKATETYQKNEAIDVGRYIALTIGNPDYYYKIVDVPTTLEKFYEKYTLDPVPAYINNSSISKVDRIIQYSVFWTKAKNKLIFQPK